MLEAWGLPLTELLRMVLRAILIAALVTAAYYLVVKYKVFAAAEPLYGTELVGLYETDPLNCGNRLAMTGGKLYVSSDGWHVIRGEATGEIQFDATGAMVGNTRFARC
jgi:hypothetical protein